MLIHLPAAVGNGILKDAVCPDIHFVQQIVPHQAPALTVARNHTDPIQVVVINAMVALIFQVIPHAVNALDKLVADFFPLADDVVPVAAQLNPPVAVVHVGKMGQTAGALFKFHQRTAVRVRAYGIGMLPILKILLCKGICPLWLEEGDLLTAVDGAEHKGIALGVGICHIRSIGLSKSILALAAHAAVAACHGSQRTVAGSINEDLSEYLQFGFGGVLVTDDRKDSAVFHHRVIHIGVQVGIQILLEGHGFPQNGIEHGERSVRIAPFVFQQHLHQNAGFCQIPFGRVRTGTHDVHTHLGTGIAAKNGTVLDDGSFHSVAGCRDCRAHAAQAASDHNDIVSSFNRIDRHFLTPPSQQVL